MERYRRRTAKGEPVWKTLKEVGKNVQMQTTRTKIAEPNYLRDCKEALRMNTGRE